MPATGVLESVASWNPWGPRPFEAGIPRDLTPEVQPWLERFETVAICGPRRAGKSTLMRQLARGLIDGGVPAANLLFVNFEEPVFLQHRPDARLLDDLFEAYRAALRPNGVPYLFLDEVQSVDGWARWVRARTDGREAHVVVSGSSSRLLEPELGVVLTGRNVAFTLWPLSFRELARFRGVTPPADAPLDAWAGPLRPLLTEHLRFGGLPEIVLAADTTVRETLLKAYFRDVIYRDVVSRHGVRDVRALEQVAHHLLVNTANLVTYNRVKDAYGLAMDQVRSYATYLAEAYLLREVPRFAFKLSTQSRSPRKVYATDVGLRNALAFRFSEDLGRLAETVVHAHLVRREGTIFHVQEKRECDFLVWRGDRAVEAVQVCYEAGDALPAREVDGLLEACRTQGLTEGTIVTDRLEGEERHGDVTVRCVPLWKWAVVR